MNLNEYQWARNPRGMHNQGPMRLEVLREQKIGWAKIVGLDDGYADFCAACLANNITPIVRIYRPAHSGVPIDPQMMGQFRTYLSAGVKWVEIYNEPNLSVEWPPGANFDPLNTAGVIAPICDNWLNWAEQIINWGGYPGFIPLSESGGGWENTTTWIDALLRYMFERHYNRFLNIINNGFWLATHPYILNHFYQEIAGRGPLSARPPEQQNYAEGGWHFEYPYDPICQASDPGRTVWGETPLVPLGDVHGLIACGLAWLSRLQELFGVGVVPVIGTEGGLWPMPIAGQVHQMDTRYPGFTIESHAHATQAIFDWISREAPPWMFGVALWKWDYYYERGLPATSIFSNTTPLRKEVVSAPAIGPYTLEYMNVRQANVVVGPSGPIAVVPPGPGAIHGEAENHFIVLAPTLDSAWFFEVGRPYWERFQPVLMTIEDFINFLPNSTSLAVTCLTTPELTDFMHRRIARRWPNVYMDMLTVESKTSLQEILNSRVASGRRFG
jgi:hypothetical protein